MSDIAENAMFIAENAMSVVFADQRTTSTVKVSYLLQISLCPRNATTFLAIFCLITGQRRYHIGVHSYGEANCGGQQQANHGGVG